MESYNVYDGELVRGVLLQGVRLEAEQSCKCEEQHYARDAATHIVAKGSVAEPVSPMNNARDRIQSQCEEQRHHTSEPI